jgi:transposase InsO family protein
MPWKETCAMDERLKFIAAHLKREYSVSELCRHFGISRPTAYKWIERYEQCGPEGFWERRRVPKHHPNETPAALQYKLIALRQRHPKWGPRKLLALLRRAEPEVSWPAVSTAGDILKRHGLTQARRYRRSTPSYDRPFYVASRPNDVWAADFKGWFKTGDGHRVDPLTISDWVSRYLLCCRGLERPIFEQVRPQFERAFREYGLPWAIRTDNGPPFASTGLGGLSRLSVWWIRLGIKPERIRPAHPEDNGRHERMHKTLKESAARPPKATVGAQQEALDQFRQEYNELRPHEALGMQTPAECYQRSDREFPDGLPELDYGPEFKIRRVRSNGQIKWAGEKIFLSENLSGELVGLKPIDNDVWSIHFGPVPLATYHGFTRSIQRWGLHDPTKKV